MLTLRFDGLYHDLTTSNPPPPASSQPARAQRIETAPKPGVMCYGWLITRHGVVIARGHGGYARREETGSNLAEYLALIEGLEALLDMGCSEEKIEVIGDARSVIEQMMGRAAVHSAATRPVYRRATRLAAHFRRLRWTWTPRKKNHEADALTRRALRQIYADRERYDAAVRAVWHTPQKRLFSLLDLRVYQPAA